MKSTRKYLLISIIFLAFILRFYKFGDFPVSIYNDEVSNGYNAYSILKSAKDEYGTFLPAIFRSFDDYKPPGYIYTLVPFIALLDLNEISVRLPSAIAGVSTVFITFVLTKRLFGNHTLAIIAALFLTISPWHIHFSRAGFEANLMIFFTLAGFTYFLISLKNPKLLSISAIFFGLSLNTYQGAKIWIPLFLLALFVFYRNEIFKFGKKLVIPILILALSTLPILVNLEDSLLRGKSVSVFARSEDPFNEFIGNYFSHFSPNFLFTAGDYIGRHSITGMGQLYVFQIPLILIGLLSLLKMNSRSSKLILTLLLIAPISAGLSTPNPHALRSLTFIPLWSIISAFGFQTILKSDLKYILKKIVILSLLMIAVFNTLLYLHLYYVHYPKEKYPDWQYGYKEVFAYVKEVKDEYSSIAISNYHGNPYIFTLFHLKYDPKKYHIQSQDKNSFDKFEFFTDSWIKSKPGKALVITAAWQGNPSKVLKEIYAPNGDIVFRISEDE